MIEITTQARAYVTSYFFWLLVKSSYTEPIRPTLMVVEFAVQVRFFCITRTQNFRSDLDSPKKGPYIGRIWRSNLPSNSNFAFWSSLSIQIWPRLLVRFGWSSLTIYVKFYELSSTGEREHGENTIYAITLTAMIGCWNIRWRVLLWCHMRT